MQPRCIEFGARVPAASVVGEQRPDHLVVEAEAAHQQVARGDLQQLRCAEPGLPQRDRDTLQRVIEVIRK